MIELGFASANCPSTSGTLVVPQNLADRRVRMCSCATFLDISTPISLPPHHLPLLTHPNIPLPPSNPPHHFLLLIHPITSSFKATPPPPPSDPPHHFLLLIHPTTSSF